MSESIFDNPVLRRHVAIVVNENINVNAVVRIFVALGAIGMKEGRFRIERVFEETVNFRLGK